METVAMMPRRYIIVSSSVVMTARVGKPEEKKNGVGCRWRRV